MEIKKKVLIVFAVLCSFCICGSTKRGRHFLVLFLVELLIGHDFLVLVLVKLLISISECQSNLDNELHNIDLMLGSYNCVLYMNSAYIEFLLR